MSLAGIDQFPRVGMKRHIPTSRLRKHPINSVLLEYQSRELGERLTPFSPVGKRRSVLEHTSILCVRKA